MHEAIVDVVLRHDRGGRLGRAEGFGGKVRRCLVQQFGTHGRISAGDAAGDHEAIFLLVGEGLVAGEGGEVEAGVLGEVRQRGLQGVNRHGRSP